jgi:hypothetical protein
MSDGQQSVLEEYSHDCQLVREVNEKHQRFHYEGPLGRVKSFESEEKARLYADVQTVTGGFREEKTGERGVPPAVARAREDVLAAYLVSNPTMGVEWVARAWEIDEDVVRNYCQMVQRRAKEQRSGEERDDIDERIEDHFDRVRERVDEEIDDSE